MNGGSEVPSGELTRLRRTLAPSYKEVGGRVETRKWTTGTGGPTWAVGATAATTLLSAHGRSSA